MKKNQGGKIVLSSLSYAEIIRFHNTLWRWIEKKSEELTASERAIQAEYGSRYLPGNYFFLILSYAKRERETACLVFDQCTAAYGKWYHTGLSRYARDMFIR